MEQKNWSVVRKAVGYHRYDTDDELALLNQIYELLRLQTNFFAPCQKLVEKHRVGAKVTKRYDTAATPYQRVMADPRVAKKVKQQLTRQYKTLNPAQIRRDLTALESLLLKRSKPSTRRPDCPSRRPRLRGHLLMRQRRPVPGHLDVRQQVAPFPGRDVMQHGAGPARVHGPDCRGSSVFLA